MSNFTIWFITGSQHLYGEETLKEVAEHTKSMVAYMNEAANMPYEIVWQPVVTTPSEVRTMLVKANADETCVGVITWMHTFSPSKMWINGLKALSKPMLHLHTQFNRDIPWETIDMDFMNLNQAAHGDKEHGFIHTRMGSTRKVVVGYYQDEKVLEKISKWMRVAAAATMGHDLKVVRFGDNMRQVAVTEGDKVEAQIKFGWEVNTNGVGDLAEVINAVTEEEIDDLIKEYEEKYIFAENCKVGTELHAHVREQAKLEIAMEKMLVAGGFGAFTNTFEDLHGMKQLPGLATQRLMEKGYGYGGEGDWKTSALTRAMKLMADNKNTTFMEDYTYHMEEGNEMVLGAHMLEVCPTVSANKPVIEVHPLGIGGKEAPARLVFDGKTGDAVSASLIEMGGRYRLVITEVEAVPLQEKMPNLPVARILWKTKAPMEVAQTAWILAGGAHHTVFSYDVTVEDLTDWAEMVDIECVVINEKTDISELKKELRMNELLWKLR